MLALGALKITVHSHPPYIRRPAGLPEILCVKERKKYMVEDKKSCSLLLISVIILKNSYFDN